MIQLHIYLIIIYAVSYAVVPSAARSVVGWKNVSLADRDIATTIMFAGTALTGLAFYGIWKRMSMTHGIMHLISSPRTLLTDLLAAPAMGVVLWVIAIGARSLLDRWLALSSTSASVYLWHAFGAGTAVLGGLSIWHLLCFLSRKQLQEYDSGTNEV